MEPSTSHDHNFLHIMKSSDPHKINQNEVSDFVRDLELPKSRPELLAPKLQQWNTLANDLRVCKYRERQKESVRFYHTENGIVACNIINGLITAHNIIHNPNE